MIKYNEFFTLIGKNEVMNDKIRNQLFDNCRLSKEYYSLSKLMGIFLYHMNYLLFHTTIIRLI